MGYKRVKRKINIVTLNSCAKCGSNKIKNKGKMKS